MGFSNPIIPRKLSFGNTVTFSNIMKDSHLYDICQVFEPYFVDRQLIAELVFTQENTVTGIRRHPFHPNSIQIFDNNFRLV